MQMEGWMDGWMDGSRVRWMGGVRMGKREWRWEG